MGKFIVGCLLTVGSTIVISIGYRLYSLSIGADASDDTGLVGSDGQPISCFNRCGDDHYSIGCQCNIECFDLNNCCRDYKDVCFSCNNRCTNPVQQGAPCQCDRECDTHGDCCEDFLNICSAITVVGNVSDDVIRELSEKLYSLDVNKIAPYVTINIQGHTKSSETDDIAPLPLFSNVSQKVLSMHTVRLFEALRDNYNKDVALVEDDTDDEKAEVTAFLDAALNTPIMHELDVFLTKQEIINTSLRVGLEQIWFTPYSRDGKVQGSSGFEHVFVGELYNDHVAGLHNWINFFREEQAGNINYMGFLDYIDLGVAGYVFTDRFVWQGRQKPIGGGYIGTSPEFDLAMFSLCFYVRPNSQCPVQTNGMQYKIQTYDYDGKQLIGTAYPLSSLMKN